MIESMGYSRFPERTARHSKHSLSQIPFRATTSEFTGRRYLGFLTKTIDNVYRENGLNDTKAVTLYIVVPEFIACHDHNFPAFLVVFTKGNDRTSSEHCARYVLSKRPAMSFDLYFCRQDKPAPSIPELKKYFSSLPLFQANDVAAGGVEFWYQNEVTGVYCLFSYSPLDAAELQGCGSSGLTFNLNFRRPSFFAYETMPLVEAFCKRFDLIVENPQDEMVQVADAAGLISSWRKHNTWAMGTMKNVAIEEDMELHYLPELSATAWWQYTRAQQALEESVKEDIFVPSLMILMNPASQVFTMMLWPKGLAQFFPQSDYVYVQREKKRLFGTKEETGLVSYKSVIAKIGHLLNEHEFGGLQLKYLPPERTAQVIPLIQTLDLEPIDLRQCTRMAADSFHDVAASDGGANGGR